MDFGLSTSTAVGILYLTIIIWGLICPNTAPKRASTYIFYNVVVRTSLRRQLHGICASYSLSEKKDYNNVDPPYSVSFWHFLDRLVVESQTHILSGWPTGQFDLYDLHLIKHVKGNEYKTWLIQCNLTWTGHIEFLLQK